MSVILVNDLKGYSRLLEGIQMFRLKEMEYIHRSTELSEERAKVLYTLYILNIKSWNNRYKDDEQMEIYTEKDFTFKILHGETTDKYKTVEQVLKSLQFLEYQIEDCDLKLNYKEEYAMKWLRALISDCERYLLRKFTQYDSTKWGL